MSNETEAFNQRFYHTLEKGIGALKETEREKLYCACAAECAQGFVLQEQKRQFAECGGDLDAQYKKYGKSEYFFADIIEPGHVYEIGYPQKCLCPMVEAGYAEQPVHCECSRQSILYVLRTLMPERSFRVEILHTVLAGAKECRFRVTVE